MDDEKETIRLLTLRITAIDASLKVNARISCGSEFKKWEQKALEGSFKARQTIVDFLFSKDIRIEQPDSVYRQKNKPN